MVVGGIAIGWFAGSLIAKFAKAFLFANQLLLAKMPSIVLRFFGIRPAINAISRVEANRITHIMQAKHNWGSIGATSWNSISSIMCRVILNGSAHAYTAGNTLYRLQHKGRTVEVIVRKANGVWRIVNAWVK